MTQQTSDELMIEIRSALAANTAMIERILKAFPDENTEGHRRYHETVIEWRELRNKLVREALIKVTSAGAVAGACWVAYAIWQAIKTTVKQ